MLCDVVVEWPRATCRRHDTDVSVMALYNRHGALLLSHSNVSYTFYYRNTKKHKCIYYVNVTEEQCNAHLYLISGFQQFSIKDSRSIIYSASEPDHLLIRL